MGYEKERKKDTIKFEQTEILKYLQDERFHYLTPRNEKICLPENRRKKIKI